MEREIKQLASVLHTFPGGLVLINSAPRPVMVIAPCVKTPEVCAARTVATAVLIVSKLGVVSVVVADPAYY